MLALLLVVLFFANTKVAKPVTIEEVKDQVTIIEEVKFDNSYGTTYTLEQISELASKYPEYKSVILKVSWCESHYKNVQSDIVSNGSRENSWGIAQINLRWHPEVSKDQALSPEFAIDFMAKRIKLGKANEWTCYRNLYQ